MHVPSQCDEKPPTLLVLARCPFAGEPRKLLMRTSPIDQPLDVCAGFVNGFHRCPPWKIGSLQAQRISAIQFEQLECQYQFAGEEMEVAAHSAGKEESELRLRMRGEEAVEGIAPVRA